MPICPPHLVLYHPLLPTLPGSLYFLVPNFACDCLVLLSKSLITMPRQRWKELDATVDIDHNPGYDLSTLTKPPPQVPSGLSTPSNFSFVCANYKWNVRREAIVKQSKVFGMITSVHFKVCISCSGTYQVRTEHYATGRKRADHQLT